MKRREFLSLCGLAAGSCLIPDVVARVIRETCVLSRQPYLVLPRNPASVLYAITNDGHSDFTFYLGDPTEEQKTPTWREYFDEYECIDIEDKDAVENWWRENVGDPAEHRSARALGVDPVQPGPEGRDEHERASQHPVSIVPDDEIDGWALENWEFRQEIYEGPMASAYRRLDELPLDDDRGLGEGNPLGELRFIEGDRPGSNLTYVEAPDLATLACLQNRLNELDENLAIEIKRR
jgi:hypothetical protein